MKLEIKESTLFGIKEIRNEGSSLNDGDWYEIIRRVNLHDELIEHLKYVSRATNSPEIGVRTDKLIKKASNETQGEVQK